MLARPYVESANLREGDKSSSRAKSLDEVGQDAAELSMELEEEVLISGDLSQCFGVLLPRAARISVIVDHFGHNKGANVGHELCVFR